MHHSYHMAIFSLCIFTLSSLWMPLLYPNFVFINWISAFYSFHFSVEIFYLFTHWCHIFFNQINIFIVIILKFLLNPTLKLTPVRFHWLPPFFFLALRMSHTCFFACLAIFGWKLSFIDTCNDLIVFFQKLSFHSCCSSSWSVTQTASFVSFIQRMCWYLCSYAF